jgi:hypothetical protein
LPAAPKADAPFGALPPDATADEAAVLVVFPLADERPLAPPSTGEFLLAPPSMVAVLSGKVPPLIVAFPSFDAFPAPPVFPCTVSLAFARIEVPVSRPEAQW